MVFNSFGQPDKVAAAQKLRAEHTALAMVNELELAGFVISHPNDPPVVNAVDKPAHRTAKIVCQHCGRHLGQLLVNPDMTVSLNSVAQKALAKLPTNCDDHKRLTNE
jgi:hypothetical protein